MKAETKLNRNRISISRLLVCLVKQQQQQIPRVPRPTSASESDRRKILACAICWAIAVNLELGGRKAQDIPVVSARTVQPVCAPGSSSRFFVRTRPAASSKGWITGAEQKRTHSHTGY
ncbi:hypothetical protein CpipJ_CPIJ012868 [Culex quinquefasciatus]|uniref:Uncharacterized protein n=1 Tax=Culex quinquefasciatus TaxID=7176 RepID=B0WZU5_CULQU|nr:hypothetical protein CpipJ_CPIJ012868 [Culex quinquefasciatus]|eukprot:XP_001862917.1 hypothetical protein CpipJ_CPIJ012868 [Culex quinquefasciatus]